MFTNVDVSELKNSKSFHCIKCDYICSKQSLWNKHILTQKHKNVDKMLKNDDASEKKVSKIYTCDCGKIYNHRQSLYVHRKKCNEHIDLTDKNVILQLLEQNKEFKELLVEQNKLIIDLCNKQFLS